MTKIKKIDVKVTYRVGLGGVVAPKKIIEQLNKIADKGDEIDFADEKHSEVRDWIQENIKERDCYEASFEITELE